MLGDTADAGRVQLCPSTLSACAHWYWGTFWQKLTPSCRYLFHNFQRIFLIFMCAGFPQLLPPTGFRIKSSICSGTFEMNTRNPGFLNTHILAVCSRRASLPALSPQQIRCSLRASGQCGQAFRRILVKPTSHEFRRVP